jgi:hypothetical protein
MALPDAITHQDRLLTTNINDAPPSSIPGVTIIPLFLDRENGVWVIYGKFAPGTTLPTHYHTGTVHFFTTKGVGTIWSTRTIRRLKVATFTSRGAPSTRSPCPPTRRRPLKDLWSSMARM